MKLNSTLIRQEREQRAWSQEHLAEVAGLALRTIQRIESSGSASYESASALATIFGLPIATLRDDEVQAATSSSGQRMWYRWHLLLTLLGCGLMAALFTPPHFRVTIPAVLTLWLGCELAIRTRGHRGSGLS